MFFLRICLMAGRSLQANLLRSLLACLGVIIGVAAVVSAMSILEGANRDVLKRFESFGADQVLVVNGTSQRSGARSVTKMSLTTDDITALTRLPTVKAVSGEVQSSAQVKYFERNRNAQILGTTDEYASINRYKVVAGRFLSHEDVRGSRKYCVLGHKIAKELFDETPAVGSRVHIGGIGFTVIGVMEKKGFLGFREVDSQVIIPLRIGMERMLGTRWVQMITVQAKDPADIKTTIQEVKRSLRREHRIRAGKSDDFSVHTQEQVKSNLADVTTIYAVVLYSIAGISLVVGGIGIMNIMLVSVTERTREIGVRMAVGAKRGDILTQFLIEAGVVSILGGILGVLLGFAFTALLEQMIRVLDTYTARSTVIWALAMAVSTGILSGLYPALRASRLDPVEALRFE